MEVGVGAGGGLAAFLISPFAKDFPEPWNVFSGYYKAGR
jgi:hypothetical protein